MARVLLTQPWLYHDEGRDDYDIWNEWRNGPYSLILLATTLRRAGHEVLVVDLHRDLISHKGDLEGLLEEFRATIIDFRPDILGVSFFSIHWFEVKRLVAEAQRTCESASIACTLIAGGIHATTAAADTIENLGFDISFLGEADIGLVRLANGERPDNVPGAYTASNPTTQHGQSIKSLDDLPFADWSFVDYKFYAHPTYIRLKVRSTTSIDMIMGRGCVYKCAFCAYYALSPTRFYSAEYLLENAKYLLNEFGIRGVYFTDSTIGNNRRLIEEFSEGMIRSGLSNQMEWYANIRPNQVTRPLLELMWRSGCRYLFYGMESGSQRVLDLMVKGMKLESSYRAAEMHRDMRFPYNASFIFGYPGETEAEMRSTIEMIKTIKAPSNGVNWYVPLPGTPDYDSLRAKGRITHDDPAEWRWISEVNQMKSFSDVEEPRFRKLFTEAQDAAYSWVPRENGSFWTDAFV